jgi:hypothetical protein
MSYIKIYETIAKYYPIGINRDSLAYENYQGTIDLKRVVADYLNSPEKKAPWNLLINNIKMDFPELQGIKEKWQPFDVCYSVALLINRKVVDCFIYEQELTCHVSFLGNYFCLYGKDSIQVNINNNKIFFEPVIVISPINNYDNYFNKIRSMVEELFPMSKFLNHSCLSTKVNGLVIFENLLKGNQSSSVFQALFVPKNITDYRTYGNILYK